MWPRLAASRIPAVSRPGWAGSGGAPVVLVPGSAGVEADPAGQHARGQAQVEGAVHVGPAQAGQEGHAGQAGQYPGRRRHLRPRTRPATGGPG